LIPYLNDDDHERLWRICDELVTKGRARAAIVCDAENGSVVISVGDTGATGAISNVQMLAPGERVVHGEAGQIYGVDVPGGALLAVLHDPPALETVRSAAAEAVRNMANLLASLPPPPAPQPHTHEAPKPKTKKRTKPKTKKKGSARKAKPVKKKNVVARRPAAAGASPRPRRRARRRSTRT